MPSVYFLAMIHLTNAAHDFGLVKVGITNGDVAARIGHLQTGNPFELRCVATFESPCARQVEHFMHRTHAADMHSLEWLRWPSDQIAILVEEAKAAARRFEDRTLKEQALRARASSGRQRRADRDEVRLHRDVRMISQALVPEVLRLEIAEHQLKAATGVTHGIRGIVRAKYIPSTIRFSAQVAEAQFPELASRCHVEEVGGTFRWRRMPRRSDFIAEHLSARAAAAAAKASADAVLAAGSCLHGWTEPTTELKRLHDDFLRATQAVQHLEADLADLQTEFTIRLGDDDALDPVCSFRRRPCLRVDSAAFCQTYPDEARHCAEPVSAKLRKHVYRTRSYL